MRPFKRKAYSVIPFLYIICGLLQQVDTLLPNSIPRKTIDFTSGDIKTFTKKGVANYSTLLISEEMNTLFVGARGAVFALDMDDITEEKYSEDWEVTKERQLECTRRGKTKDVDCQNYILLLQKLNTTTLYVCGSNAFYPSCDYLFLSDNGMHLERKAKESKGMCPFDPTLRFTSLLIDGELYSATFRNFLGTEPIIYRSLKNHLQTELKSSWLNEPSFVHMDVVQESENSEDGDDDKVYIFFSETAIEFEFYDKLLVSRIARVCKGDHGGKRILQKKWTSFLKASLICSAPESNFQFNIVQDVFLLKTANWSQTIFYGVFTQQWGKLDISAVCAFSIERVREVFSQGKYKELVTVEHSHFKWVMYSGEVLIPRPGACINNSARYSTSLDLPDKTLQFIKDHPLMDDAVYPIGNKPVLLKRGANYTKIVVDRVKDINQEAYDVMFIGTDNGFLHKALNCDGEMFIVEETQLFQSPEPVQSLKLSSKKGLLYAGSPSQVVQIPISLCDRHTNCLECVLARDPYCAWSFTMHECVTVADHIDDSQEQPIFSARAHVFQIDPSTKRNWIPASKHALTVSYFYDATRNVYRVISVGGTKAIINSTITPNMTFTKTSQKFGQWADSRANTVYGLGFASEQQLSQFAEKFQEVKEAARLAREKSQDKTELTHPTLHFGSHQALPSPVTGINGPGDEKLFRSQSADTELTTEKERLKKMLSEGSVCEVQWEAEFFSVQDNNKKLVAALHEANASVEQWKKQLAAYQVETERLRERVSELEAQEASSNVVGTSEQGRSAEDLEVLLKAREQEIHTLKSQKPEAQDLESERDVTLQKLQETEARNAELEQRLQHAEEVLTEVLLEREKIQREVSKVGEMLDVKLFELSELRQSLAKLTESD